MPLRYHANTITPDLKGLAVCVASMMTLALGGCAGGTQDLTSELLGSSQPQTASAQPAEAPQTEIEKATSYWGEKFSKSPNNLEYALSYARNLKAMGRKQPALAVLQQASAYHGQNRELAGEYGRLALELGQTQIAKSVLAYADDPVKPDWRIISARGTVLSKEGNHKDAIPLFQRALVLSNNSPSVMNNLAMAYALDGRAAEGEQLLRQAAKGNSSVKVQRNLALVLGLQGKYDEATVVGTRVLDPSAAKSDTQLVKQMVRLDPKPYLPAPGPTTAIAQAPLKPIGGQAQNVAQNAVTMRPNRPALRQTTQQAESGSWDSRVATTSP